MKISELRLGNYVKIDGEIHRITLEHFGDPEILKRFEPIPLTEDWMIKWRWLKKPENGRFGYIYFMPHFDYNFLVERDWQEYPSHFFGHEYTDAPDESDNHVHHHFSFDLKYVHQLQNLFFSCSGDELMDELEAKAKEEEDYIERTEELLADDKYKNRVNPEIYERKKQNLEKARTRLSQLRTDYEKAKTQPG